MKFMLQRMANINWNMCIEVEEIAVKKKNHCFMMEKIFVWMENNP